MSETTHSEAPRYKGRVILVVPAREGRPRLVKVVVDDVGQDQGQAFWVDHNNTPEWLSPQMAVEFWLVPIGKPDPRSNRRRPRIATNVVPQAA